MRKGTFGSDVCCGNTPGPTRQALLIARSSRPRAFCTSWWIKVVASLSRSQVIARHPRMLRVSVDRRLANNLYSSGRLLFGLVDQIEHHRRRFEPLGALIDGPDAIGLRQTVN